MSNVCSKFKNSETPQRYMTVDEAAIFLGISVATMNKDRIQKTHNFPFYRIGRAIRYSQAELIAWMERHRAV